MVIVVVTNSESVRTSFASICRSRAHSLEFVPHDELARAVRHAAAKPEALLYVDIGETNDQQLKRLLGRLRNALPCRFGIIDTHDRMTDVAEPFHESAIDYLGSSLLRSGFRMTRLRRLARLLPSAPVDPLPSHVPEYHHQDVIPSGCDWSGIADGDVYTFIMVYAGIDQPGDLRRKSSEQTHAGLRACFRTMLERAFAEYGGRVWMAKGDEALLLFPFDGRRITPFIPALRLLLNRPVIITEEYSRSGELNLSWRLAMHLGNTTYASGRNTGTIVSESVNFLFHLGSRFLGPGALAVTEACHALLPQRLQSLMVRQKPFESVPVYTLRTRQ
jgi:hypothetical protein